MWLVFYLFIFLLGGGVMLVERENLLVKYIAEKKDVDLEAVRGGSFEFMILFLRFGHRVGFTIGMERRKVEECSCR